MPDTMIPARVETVLSEVQFMPTYDAESSNGMRIGILGGTFNPIHNGHLLMAENALDQLGLDRVLFAPAGVPPHKSSAGVLDRNQRFHLVELAVADRPGFQATRIDLDDAGRSYTWILLERCRRAMPGARFHFILGGDSLAEFDSWSRPERVVEMARIAVIPRPGVTIDTAMLDRIPGLRESLDWIDVPYFAVSSSEIRRRRASAASIRYLVPNTVRETIEREGWYLT